MGPCRHVSRSGAGGASSKCRPKAKDADTVYAIVTKVDWPKGKRKDFTLKSVRATGASESGITMLTDPDGSLTKAMGLDFSAPPVGFINRTRRFAALVEDGVIRHLSEETERGVCDFTSGERMLEQLGA